MYARTLRGGLLLIMMAVTSPLVAADESSAPKPVRIGAVAYSPSVVKVFQGLKQYLNNHDFPADYVLYSNYDALVAALDKGEIEIAWNTPLAHAQYHVKNACASQTLVMRDVDRDVHSVLLVRADSDIQAPKDLAGKRLILGSEDAAEATVLPLHFLAQQGLDVKQVTVVSLDQEVDFKGNPCCSPEYVLKALREGRGDAGIVTEDLWRAVQDQKNSGPELRAAWTSPAFSHCVFTAAAGFDKQLASRFTELMVAMKPDDAATADVMSLEGTRAWLPGSPDGFENLVEALRAKE
jgi:ABC-type phosphate/phosphonate transport system substrate-binding protein